MKYPVCLFLLTLLVAVPGAQQQEPDPHAGQPSYCVNHGGFKDFPMEEPHICACDKPCHEGQPEDTKCLVYCRKDHCHCFPSEECEREPPK